MDVMLPPMATTGVARERAAARRELVGRVKALLVRSLDLAVDPGLIADDQALFGRGLELDSIDTLELAIAVEEEFGVQLTDDDVEAMLSVNRLVDHIVSRGGATV